MKLRHSARLSTVAFVRHEDSVLLLRHGPGSDRFRGLWNGVGGHVEAGEEIRAAARRELREEAGIDAVNLRLRGVVHESGMQGHAYVVFFFVGEADGKALAPAPAHELAWHRIADLAGLPLVPDLRELLPRLLSADEPLFATERYDSGDESLELAIGEEER